MTPIVRNMRTKTGGVAANQFIITTEGAIYMQSYESVIAKVERSTGHVTLGRNWDFSSTTSRYLSQFLTDVGADVAGTRVPDLRKAIKDGSVTLDLGMN